MPNGKQYLSTEVAVHRLEIEFVDRFIEYDETLAELYYWLDHLPESLRPEAQRHKQRIQHQFHSVMQAARLAGPMKRRT